MGGDEAISCRGMINCLWPKGLRRGTWRPGTGLAQGPRTVEGPARAHINYHLNGRNFTLRQLHRHRSLYSRLTRLMSDSCCNCTLQSALSNNSQQPSNQKVLLSFKIKNDWLQDLFHGISGINITTLYIIVQKRG